MVHHPKKLLMDRLRTFSQAVQLLPQLNYLAHLLARVEAMVGVLAPSSAQGRTFSDHRKAIHLSRSVSEGLSGPYEVILAGRMPANTTKWGLEARNQTPRTKQGHQMIPTIRSARPVAPIDPSYVALP
jgi:hypothetical protein